MSRVKVEGHGSIMECEAAKKRIRELERAGRAFLKVTAGIADVELWRAEAAFTRVLKNK